MEPRIGERADAEDQAGCDERLRDPARLTVAGETALEPGADGLEPFVESQQLPDHHASEEPGEHRQLVAGARLLAEEDLERHRHADDHREEPETGGERLLHAPRHPRAEHQADRRTDEHGGHVEQGPGQEHRPILAAS